MLQLLFKFVPENDSPPFDGLKLAEVKAIKTYVFLFVLALSSIHEIPHQTEERGHEKLVFVDYGDEEEWVCDMWN